MPLTGFQQRVLAALAVAPNDARYLAGGAALHFTPGTARYSDDLDFFHDSESRVAAAFGADRELLTRAGFELEVELSQPGFVRAVVRQGEDATRVDWAHDSAWRFLPLKRDALGGWMLDPMDLAINKVLALAGREEPRDFVDILFVHQRILALAAVAWAAVGKDPGYTPLSLLELLKRRGRYRPEEFARLNLAEPFDPVRTKPLWQGALQDAEHFAARRPPAEAGCLYWATEAKRFVLPSDERSLESQGIVPHFGAPGGVVPRMADSRVEN